MILKLKIQRVIMTVLVNIKEIKTGTRTRASRSRRSSTHPLGMGISGIFLMLILAGPGMLPAQTSEAPKTAPAPVPDEQVRHSDDSGQSSAVPEVKTYEELRRAISEARAQSRTRVEKAVDQERVREAWEIGRLIDAHVLQHKERADYGEKVLERLSDDLGMSRTELSYMLQFVRAYPIIRPAEKLTWSHYEALLSVNDPKEREALAERAEKENWNRDRLREEIKAVTKKEKPQETAAAEKLPPLYMGKPGTYKIVKATVGPESGKVVIDLGFSNYYRTSKNLRFKEGDIIEATPPDAGASTPSDRIRLSKRTLEDLYTYRAWVARILDGDTLEVVVDLGFGVRSVQTLRLRGLDCPELVSKEGKEAKEFVEKILGKAEGEQAVSPFSKGGKGDLIEISTAPSLQKRGAEKKATSILIKTTKSDKYDRYLVDVFIPQKDGSNLYLNSELLEKGLAVNAGE